MKFMQPKRRINSSALISCLLAACSLCNVAQAAPRPEASALKVADGAVAVDGRDSDWRIYGAALEQGRKSVLSATSLTFTYPDRCTYSGPDDIGFTAWLAMDSANLYVLADVRDQLLINDAVRKIALLVTISKCSSTLIHLEPTSLKRRTKTSANGSLCLLW